MGSIRFKRISAPQRGTCHAVHQTAARLKLSSYQRDAQFKEMVGVTGARLKSLEVYTSPAKLRNSR
jgi:hypothetical protein